MERIQEIISIDKEVIKDTRWSSYWVPHFTCVVPVMLDHHEVVRLVCYLHVYQSMNLNSLAWLIHITQIQRHNESYVFCL